ncbi:MAG: dihydropteroate synthase [Betaproteobacteria bacterium]|nr:dihydropteroate synthase [Betaproteobacteria bacterium]
MFFHCGQFQFDLSRPLVMGIVNVTPDSFSDGGRTLQCGAALAHAHQLIEEGADILDIGGESTRPGALPVSVQEELERIMPVIEGLRGAPVPVSVDTCKPEVMRAALAAGASMVNDINALQQPSALAAVTASSAAVCLMHKQGTPQTMQQQPQYQDVVAEVLQFLRGRMDAAQAAGIARERIVVDPGVGFGKTLAHNLALLRDLGAFGELGVPLLAGLSRKSMLGTITGQDVEHRVSASVAAALLAVQRGARIVRVHDVGATCDALKVWNAVNS